MILTKRAAEFKAVTHVTQRFFQRSHHSISTLFIIQLRSLNQNLKTYRLLAYLNHIVSTAIIFLLFGFDVSVFTYVSKNEKKSFECSFRRYNGCI